MDNLETRVSVLESLFNERHKAQEKALSLQAQIYEKHLTDLNHEAERLINMQKSYPSLDSHTALVDRVNDLVRFKEQSIGRHSNLVYIAIGSLIISLLTFISNFTK